MLRVHGLPGVEEDEQAQCVIAATKVAAPVAAASAEPSRDARKPSAEMIEVDRLSYSYGPSQAGGPEWQDFLDSGPVYARIDADRMFHVLDALG